MKTFNLSFNKYYNSLILESDDLYTDDDDIEELLTNIIHSSSVEKAEKIISKSARLSYRYANELLDSRFKLGEPAIATKSWYSYHYAYNVLNRNEFKLGEPAIAKDPRYSLDYASFILYGRFELGEDSIAKRGWIDAYIQSLYRNNVDYKEIRKVREKYPVYK